MFVFSFSSNNAALCLEPGSPPDMIVITTVTSRSVTLTWKPPIEPNGFITEYRFQCFGENHAVNSNVMGSQTTITLSGLLPYTNYSCSITAHTSAGGGPAATASVNTLQDSEPDLDLEV